MIAAISARGRTGLRNSSVLFGFLMLLAIRAVASQASLAWDPSPDPSVAGYVLYYGEASRSYMARVNVGSQTSYTVPNLLEGHNYFFAVAARNSTGTESALSNEASAFMAVSGPVLGTVLASATLPSSRAVQVGSPLTIFATIINAGSSVGTGCSIGLNSNVPATFGYQTTNPSTNALSGTPNTPVNLVPGASQSFVLSLTPSAPISATDVQFTFSCANSSPAGVLTGINTLLLSASTTPTPDVIALAATTTADGIVTIPGTSGTGAFAVASANVGSAGSITVTADTGGTAVPIGLSLCQTNPSTGGCLQPAASSVPVTVSSGATPTFSVFIGGSGAAVPFNPASNRVFLRFRNSANGVVVGATSVAIKTQ